MRAKLKAVSEIVFWVKDVEAAKDWYEQRFELELGYYSVGQYAFLKAESFTIALFNPADPGSDLSKAYLAHTGGMRGDLYHVALQVEPGDLDSCAAAIAGSGTPVSDLVTFDSGQRSYYFEDLDGHYIELTDR
ncbi:MAG: VOC family protein [Armatimonadetes bacterium]|nr:VOC family protein [Armatimonadota bacterium]